jgi:BRCT domain type II-containing protein
LHAVKNDTPSAEPATAPKETSSPKKTKSPEEQRAANASKTAKSTDDDLPENIRTLLAGTGDILSGKSIVVTGVPPTLQRKNAEKLVQIYGGKLLKAVSGKTDFVVVGNEAGPTKLEKIESLGITTMDEDEFIEMLEEGIPADDKPKAKRQKR